MNMHRIGFGVMLVFLWVMMILLGSIVLETFMIYPNIFHNAPESFETALAFMSVRAPSDFFPPLGFVSWVSGTASVMFAWRVKSARYWVLASVLMIVCEGLFSMYFFWPRNTIMAEGTAVHSVAYLQRTAQEFQTGHWLRVAMSAAASACSFLGFLKFYRHRITS